MLRVVGVTPAVSSSLLPVLIATLPTVLATFAFLTLPASPDPLRDLDVVTGVEVMLAACGAVQQVTQLRRRQLSNLEKITFNNL